MNRRTGKTFQLLLEALKLASEGQYIIYECNSRNMAQWTMGKALDIIHAYGLETDAVNVEVLTRSIRFISGGAVRFISLERNGGETRGVRYEKIISDLRVIE